MATIYIVSENGKLQKKGDTLQLTHHDGTISTIFPFKTEQLVILGSVEITGGALRTLMRHGIETIFLSSNGKFQGKLVFQEHKNVFLRQKQFRLLDSHDFRSAISQAIVEGKLKNQLSFMQRITRRDEKRSFLNQVIENMKRNIQKVSETKDLASLRGLEGIGAKYFFSVFRENIIPEWAVFNGRSMNPPEDNVNAVLSFLYTLILNRVDASIEEEGLDPYVGYYHELDYGKRTLAFDLMEEYRTPLADTLCCALFNLGVLSQDDFREVVFSSESEEFPLATEISPSTEGEEQPVVYQEKKGVLLTKEGLKKVIAQFEKKLETQLFYTPLSKHLSYKRIIREQVRHFRRVLAGEEREYKPLVMK
ncbi:MAG: CRISPR-associated endonuclease Cas1 [Spirochaetes bacterium]|nr:CRISPR-associated endonuclease Cas1 [Spirochaetota bacterium]